MFTISIIIQKGGTGKSVLTRCLAVAFERSGTPAAVLDMDAQGSVSTWGKRRKAERPEIIPTIVPLLDDALEAARKSVEVVIIDTPGKSADLSIAAARVADLIIVPCRPQIDDIDTLPATKQIFNVVAPNTPAFVLLSDVPTNPERITEATEAISGHETAPFPVCPHTFGHRVAFGDSSVSGLTPQEYEPRGDAAKEIEIVHKYVSNVVRNIRSEKNDETTKHQGPTATAR